MCTDTCYGCIIVIKVGLLWGLLNIFCMHNSPVFAFILAKVRLRKVRHMTRNRAQVLAVPSNSLSGRNTCDNGVVGLGKKHELIRKGREGWWYGMKFYSLLLAKSYISE